MDKSDQMTEFKNRYLEALVAGEAVLAQSIIDQAVSMGLSHAEIYVEVLGQSQVRLGDMWHEGRLNVAQEHLAATITLEMMDYLRQGMQPHAELGVRAVVTPVEGDQHCMGARMIADFLVMDGWEVDYLGNGTPAEDLRDFVQQRGTNLVALSSTLPEFLPNATRASEAIRELVPHRPKILLGGAALEATTDGPESYGCDAICRDALKATSEARLLVGLSEKNLSLGEHLSLMGRRINAERTSRRMTQQQLADAAELDRTYISLVEHGKQNLSIGAVLKIANALEMPMGDLLALPSPGSQLRHK